MPPPVNWQITAGKYKNWWGIHPDSNIGIATGHGLLVLDFDGEEGLASLAMLDALGLPQSYRVKTPSGGVHVYFTCPLDCGITVSVKATEWAGLDVRCDGGFVVGAGSVIGPQTYVGDGEIEAAPDWVLDFCRAPHEHRSRAVATTREPLVELDTEVAIARAEQWVKDHAPEAYSGGRNAAATVVAGRMHDLGLSEAAAIDQAHGWNGEKVYPPLDPEEIEKTVSSMYRSAKGGWGGALAAADFEAVEILEPPIPVKRKGLYWVGFEAAASTALQQVTDPLVEEFLTRGSLSVLYGDSNSGKTFVMLDIAYHIAAGRPWQGRKVARGLVVYIAAEGGQGIRKRLAALAKHYGESDVPFMLVPCPVNLLDARADLPQLLALIKEAEEQFNQKATLIVIDTLSRALAGGDENTSTDMGGFIRNVDSLRTQTGAHLALVHHTGKDQAKGARGWSGLRAAVDTEIEIKNGEISVTKQRDMDYGAPMKFALDQVEVGHDQEGRRVTSCVVRVLTGTEFMKVEMTGAEAELYEVFADCAKQKCIDQGLDVGDWKMQKVSTEEWDIAYLEAVSTADSGQLNRQRPGTSARTIRRLRTALANGGQLRKDDADQWFAI